MKCPGGDDAPRGVADSYEGGTDVDGNTIRWATIETAPIGVELMQVVGATGEQAVTLQHVAAAAQDAAGNVYRDSPSTELRESASRIRDVVLHGLHVLGELQAQASRLEGLAAAQTAVEEAEMTTDGRGG
jgi:hypothetical protein